MSAETTGRPDVDHIWLERAAILATAVGRARLALKQGDAPKAQLILDDATERSRKLLRDALVEVGMKEEDADSILGLMEAEDVV